jgi:hypothetical protein
MKLQSENNAKIKSNTHSRNKNNRVDIERACAWNHTSAQTVMKMEQAEISRASNSIGILPFGSSYRATSPKMQELLTRQATHFATEDNRSESGVKLKC